jgi:hypothetical protein
MPDLDVTDILTEVYEELDNGRRKHGVQHELPSFGEGPRGSKRWTLAGDSLEEFSRRYLDEDPSWAAILGEEVGEALQERDPVKLRAELVQVAAMAVGWISKLDNEDSEAK